MKLFKPLQSQERLVLNGRKGVEYGPQCNHVLVDITARLYWTYLGQRTELCILRKLLTRLACEADGVVDDARINIQIGQVDVLICAPFMLHTCRIVKVDGQARVVIDFEYPRLQCLIDEDIET